MLDCHLGDTGPVVGEIRAKLSQLRLAEPGDVFDDSTDRAVRAFQQQRGLRVDGVVGWRTYRALDEAHWKLGDRVLSHVVGHAFVGDDVVALQERLIEFGFDPGRSDGVFGVATAAALREFQRGVGLPPDGTVGPSTLSALQRLLKTVVGGSPSARREEERLRLAGESLRGRVIVLDPGHGGGDAGACGYGLREADIALDIAARLEGRLAVLGVRTHLTRGSDTCPDDQARARLANDVEADATISLHVDRVSSALASGVATVFYGATVEDRQIVSAMGQRLANLVQSEIVARTNLLDCRIHPKTWELLRYTQMPAVRTDIGYLSNAADAELLASGRFRDTVAEAIVTAIRGFYLTSVELPMRSQQLAAIAG